MAYATWNPADKDDAITLSNSNLTATNNSIWTNWPSVRGTFGMSSGKWYWELTDDVSGSPASVHNILGIGTLLAGMPGQIGEDIYAHGYTEDGRKFHNNVHEDYGNTYQPPDIIGFALDMDAGKIWWSKNGVWQGSGDPVAGTNPAYSGLSGTFYPMCAPGYFVGDQFTANFGASAFTYSVPSGFSAGLVDPPQEGSISEDVNVLSEFDDNWPEISEDVNISSEFTSRLSTVWISEGVNVNTEFNAQDPYMLDEEVSVNTGMEGFYTGDISEDVSVNSGFISEHTGSILENASVASEFTSAHTGDLSEEASVNSEFVGVKFLTKTISETLSAWETLGWGWNKTVLDSMAIADTAEKILGIPVRDWITLTDTQTNNWNGSEAISDSFYAVDIPKVIQIYRDLVEDGMAIADAVNLALQLVITDILTCTDTIIDTGTFQHSIEDGMTLADAVKRFFPKTVLDSFAATDTSLFDLLAFLQIADSLSITEITTPGLTINQTIADTLAVADTIALQQFLQELIQDGLDIEVIVELDGELYECWSLSTAAFHPSVYSNYGYNSFAEFNNTVYGCKSDGIYELAGDTDNGTEFHSGIVLPQTNFGSAHNKRFRKAWFGVSGDNLTMKMETESGSKTFTMTDMEMSITRDLHGRKWLIKLEDFDSLDFVELTQVLLSRK